MKSVITISSLGKRYRLGSSGQHGFQTLRERLTNLLSGKTRADSPEIGLFWALRDVTLDVEEGEVLGIIGQNGAGKSTLLKILSRITEPSVGEFTLRGRVASLLEVGTGFHPELSGRENIYLNGVILGMKRREVKQRFDEIVEFSGVEQFIDTPVKRYSSGMYVRLAFAVAAHLEPEILIVDEVLAVGDAEFQKKCLGKMKDFAGHGRTVLFVSHNMTAVTSLCDRTILLRKGQIAADGKTKAVICGYQNFEFKETLQRSWAAPSERKSYQQHGIYLKEARVVFDRETDDLLRVGAPFQLKFCVHSRSDEEVNLSPHYLGVAGEIIFAAPSPKYRLKPGDNWFTCHIPGQFFNDGLYTLMVMIVKNSGAIETVDEALIFEVHEVERSGNWFGKWPGVVRPRFEWDYQQAESNLLP